MWATLGDGAMAYFYTALAVELGVLEVAEGAYELPSWEAAAAAQPSQRAFGEAAAPTLRTFATLLAMREDWRELEELAAALLALFLRVWFSPRLLPEP